jgi:two-component system, NtrC family, nitrogen regulation sensor histidine kinase NtrY
MPGAGMDEHASASLADASRMARSRRSPRLTHDQRIVLLALAAAAPGALTALLILWTGDYTPKVQWTLTVIIGGFLLGFLSAMRTRVVTPLQTTANLLSALREGDFSIRARGSRSGDPLNDVMIEVNVLADTLRGQRLDALEATALLRKVMVEIDVAVFTFDERQRLQLVNRAGERLLGTPAERLLERTAQEIELEEWLLGDSPRIAAISFPGGSGRWEIRHTSFRQHGLPHQLLVLADVSKPLREEERQAWQRLIRVLGHELNNSLAPIKSIAGSLGSLLKREPLPPDWDDDLSRGLSVISARADALSRFMGAYARLARLPPPRFHIVPLAPFFDRIASLETRMPVAIDAGPDLDVRADSDQLEQLLINLVKNAVDAAQETGGGVSVTWLRVPGATPFLEIRVEDEGPGLSNTANLFVPFFTTKPAGSGIGLVLSRQIAEAHGGSLTLENREDTRGCRAVLRLPL